jgi:hypothetical protein
MEDLEKQLKLGRTMLLVAVLGMFFGTIAIILRGFGCGQPDSREIRATLAMLDVLVEKNEKAMEKFDQKRLDASKKIEALFASDSVLTGLSGWMVSERQYYMVLKHKLDALLENPRCDWDTKNRIVRHTFIPRLEQVSKDISTVLDAYGRRAENLIKRETQRIHELHGKSKSAALVLS